MVITTATESIAMRQEKPPDALKTQDPSSYKPTMKEITVSFITRTKIHGLKFMFSPDKSLPLRFIWVLAFLFCLGLLFTWSWNRILYLMSYPAVTKIHMVWAHNMSFPTVTFCNKNVFRVSSLTREDLYHSGYWMDLLYSNHTIMEGSLSILKDSHKKGLLNLLDFNKYSPPPGYRINTTEMMGRLGHQLEDMLLECKFRGETCTHKNFTPIYTRYGKCYTFNSGQDGNPLLTTLKGGTGNGLEIMLDIQQDEYLPVWGETDETSYEAGIKVQLHSHSEPAFLHELGFGVAPGFQTFVSTQQQRVVYECGPAACQCCTVNAYPSTAQCHCALEPTLWKNEPVPYVATLNICRVV